jgi:hypothetical protein
MIVGKFFPGDDNETLKWVQHDAYPGILSWLYTFPAQRYINAAKILEVQDDRFVKITAIQGFDHRVLQAAHDHIAAYFRKTFDPHGQMVLPFDGLSYQEHLASKWIGFFRSTCQDLAEDDLIARCILDCILNQNTAKGYENEDLLKTLLQNRFPLA